MSLDMLAIDWRNSWIELQRERRPMPDVKIWDERADSFSQRKGSSYTKTFFEYLNLSEGQSVLDMGCGPGDLAISMAADGHNVVAADFSTKMLENLAKNAQKAGVQDRIRIEHMAWEDDWTRHGLVENSVDVAIASRSIIVPDLGKALDKLSSTASKRVAITLATGGNPSEDPGLLKAIGRSSVGEFDIPCCFNILYQMGYRPEIRYIDYDKHYSFSSLEEAVQDRTSRIYEITDKEMELAREYLASRLVEDPEAKGMYTLNYKRATKWAFISWEL